MRGLNAQRASYATKPLFSGAVTQSLGADGLISFFNA